MSNNDFRTLAVEMYASHVATANAIATEVAASGSGVNRQIKDLRENPDSVTDASLADAIRKWAETDEALAQKRAENRDKIDSMIAEHEGLTAMDDDTRSEKHDEYKTARSAATTARKLLETMPGYDASWVEDVPALLNFSTGKPSGQRSGGTGGGGFRPRLASATVNGEDVSVDGKVTYTVIAQHVTKISGTKVQPRELQEATLETAQAENFDNLTEVDFVYSVDGDNFDISVTFRTANE